MDGKQRSGLRYVLRVMLTLFVACQVVWSSVPTAAIAEVLDALPEVSDPTVPDEEVVEEEVGGEVVVEDDGLDAQAAIAEELDDKAADAADELVAAAEAEAGKDELIRSLYERLSKSKLADDELSISADEAAIRALAGDETDAAGITRAFVEVASDLDIECIEVVGEDGAIWAMAKVGDAWYHVDAAQAALDAKKAFEEELDAPDVDAWLLISDSDVREAQPDRGDWKVAKEDGAADDEADVPEADEPYVWADEPTDEEGEPTDEEAEPTDEEGEPTDEEGEPTDEEAEPTDEEGEPTDDEAEPTDEEAEPTDEEGEPTDEEAEPTDDEAEPTDEEAEPTDEEEPAEDEQAETVAYEYEDDDFKVVATPAEADAIPADAKLKVTAVKDGSDQYNYIAYLAAMNASIENGDPYNAENSLLLDVAFLVTDEEGNVTEVQPSKGSVTISIQFKDAEALAKLAGQTNELRALHLSLKAEARAATTAEATEFEAADVDIEKLVPTVNEKDATVELVADAFSVFALVSTISGQKAGAFGAADPIPGLPTAANYPEPEDELVAQAVPSSYSSVKLNYVTTPKDQNPYGTCWAFSTIANFETSMIRRGSSRGFNYTKNNLNLSELQFAYFSYNRKTDPLGYTAGDAFYCEDSFLDGGGFSWQAAYSAVSWTGPVDDSLAPYSMVAPYGPYYPDPTAPYITLDNSLAYGSPKARVSDFRRVALANRTKVKQVIMNYGAVQVNYRHDDAYVNNNYGTYYNPNEKDGGGHAVTIVGWDDNFSKSKFNYTPAGNGAWLIKNSWGTGWGNNGYFWMSYYDKSLPYQSTGEAYFYDLVPANTYKYIYQHDGGLIIDAKGVQSGGSVANIFTAKGGNSGEGLTAVGIALEDTNVQCSVQIYKNVKGNNPTSGTKCLSKPATLTTSYAGYYTIKLPSPVLLNKGTKFSVVITLRHANGSEVGYAVDSTIDAGYYAFTSAADYGESFVKYSSGSGWTDLKGTTSGSGGSNCVARIKAYTISANKSGNLKNAKITVADQTYTGKKRTPNPKVVLNGWTLEKGTDYTLKYKNNVKAGISTARVTITGKGKIKGTRTLKFSILFKDVPKKNKHWAFSYIYKAAQKGLIMGYGGGKTGYFGPNDNLTRGQVATMLWRMAGQPKVGSGAKNFPDVFKGKYYYTAVRWASSKGIVNGGKDGTFRPDDNVTRQQLVVMVANYASVMKGYKINGKASSYSKMKDRGQVASYAVKSMGFCFQKKIMPDRSGMTTIRPNAKATRAETAVLLVRLSSLPKNKPSIAKAKFKLSATKYTYNGKAKKPTVTVKMGSKTLKKGTHYTVTYKNNVKAGTASVIIKGKGKYGGSKTLKFTIAKANVKNAKVAKIANKSYTGKAIKPSPKVTQGGRTLKKGTDYTLSYKNNVKVGTATVTITGKGNYTGKKSVTFKIVRSKVSITKCKITGIKSKYNYTGKQIKPNPTVKYGSTTLKKGTDYTVSYGTNKNLGTGTVVIKGKGNYTGSVTKKFTIVAGKVLACAVLYDDGELVLQSDTNINADRSYLTYWTSDVSDHPWTGSSYNNYVTKVSVKGAVYVGDCNSMFYNLPNLVTANLTNLDTSRVTDMAYMFEYCSSLRTASVWNWNTTNVTSMRYMFDGCSSITSLSPAKWNTAKVTDMCFMFRNCSSCNSWNINKLKTNSCERIWGMFKGCTNMGNSQNFNLSSWKTGKIWDMDSAFYDCPGITQNQRNLHIDGWDHSSVSSWNNLFNDSGYRYCPSWARISS